MNQIVLFALLGLGPGALIAGLAVSLVITYRGSGTVNVATGALAAVGGFTYYGLNSGGYLWLVPIPGLPHKIDLGGPWGTVPAVLAAIVVTAVVGAVFDLVILRQLRASSPLAKLLASLGLLSAIQAALVLQFGSDGQQAQGVFPDDSVSVGGISVPSDRLWLGAVMLVTAIGVACIYRFTRFGVTTRAAAENETLTVLGGLSPTWLSVRNTAGAAAVAGALGALAASQVPLDPFTVPIAVVPALAAALLARFDSVVAAALLGLAMGVAQSLVGLAQSRPWFPTSAGQPVPGVSDLLFLVVVVIAVIARGSALPVRGAVREKRLPQVPAATRVMGPAALAVLVVVIAFISLPFGFRQALINSCIGIVVCLSLTVITGFVGQVSLLQIALSGVSGFVVSEFASSFGIGFPLAPIAGVAAAVLFGLLTAVSAVRVRGVNLAIVSIAAAVALQTFGFENPVWGGGTSTLNVPEPHLFGLDLGPLAAFPVGGGDQPSPLFGILCGLVTVGVAVLVANLRRSELGKRMLAVRSNERAAAAVGISVRSVKLTAFALSSGLAGIAGVLYAYDFRSVSASRFDVVLALTFVSFAYLGGITTVTGAIFGGLAVSEGLAGYVLNTYTSIAPEDQLLIGGLALMFVITRQPDGAAGALLAGRRRRQRRREEASQPTPAGGPAGGPTGGPGSSSGRVDPVLAGSRDIRAPGVPSQLVAPAGPAPVTR